MVLACLDEDGWLDAQLVKGAVVAVCPHACCLDDVLFGCVARVCARWRLRVEERRVVDIEVSISPGVCYHLVKLAWHLEPAEVGEATHGTLKNDGCPTLTIRDDHLEELCEVHASPYRNRLVIIRWGPHFLSKYGPAY